MAESESQVRDNRLNLNQPLLKESTMKKYRVIQWGVGYTGSYSLRYILSNPQIELVGVKCFSADKEGKHAGEFCNRGREGVKATCDKSRLLALEADCVIFMPRDYLTDPSVPGGPAHVPPAGQVRRFAPA